MATTLPLPSMHLVNTVHQFRSSCSLQPETLEHIGPHSTEVAENYSRYNMPRGWMLVNDGYGCGYTTQDMLIQTQKDRRFFARTVWVHSMHYVTMSSWPTRKQSSCRSFLILLSLSFKATIFWGTAWISSGHVFRVTRTTCLDHLDLDCTEQPQPHPLSYACSIFQLCLKYVLNYYRIINTIHQCLPSQLTWPFEKAILKMMFPFPKVGYVGSLCIQNWARMKQVMAFAWVCGPPQVHLGEVLMICTMGNAIGTMVEYLGI